MQQISFSLTTLFSHFLLSQIYLSVDQNRMFSHFIHFLLLANLTCMQADVFRVRCAVEKNLKFLKVYEKIIKVQLKFFLFRKDMRDNIKQKD